MLIDIAVFIVFIALSYGSGLGMIKFTQIIDVPNERSSHTQPTPRAGGVGIVLVFVLGFFWLVANENASTDLWGLTLIAVVLALVSLKDDIRALSAELRLSVHVVAMCLVLWFIKPMAEFDLGSFSWQQPQLLALFSALWILGLTNAVNFMDGIDGLVAGVSTTVLAFWAVFCFQAQAPDMAVLSLALVAGNLGFLLLNWSPAKLFMGDVGSVFLGFVLAGFALIGTQLQDSIPIWVMPLLLLHFLVDTIATFGARLIKGEAVFEAHRSHIYQRLTQLGMSHSCVSLIYIALTLVQGLLAFTLLKKDFSYPWLIILLITCSYAVITAIVWRKEQHSNQDGRNET